MTITDTAKVEKNYTIQMIEDGKIYLINGVQMIALVTMLVIGT